MEVIAAGVQTVTMAAALSTVASGTQVPFTRTQYDVVEVGETVTEPDVAPATGLVVVPGVPMYHW